MIEAGILSLRRATPADAEAVRALTRLAYAPWVKVIGREPKPMTANYDRAVREHIIDLHEINGKLMALIELIAAPDHLFIENIAVHPDHNGGGIGSALLRHAEQAAASAGLSEVRLLTNAAFASNINFYAKHGYTLKTRTNAPETGETVYMAKSIHTGSRQRKLSND